MKLRFRPNVAAIIRNAEHRVLVGERIDMAGAWQFPQGGVDPGETLHGALIREMREELSLDPRHYEILEQKGPYRYVLPDGRRKKGFHGQEQQYFLLRYFGPEDAIDVRTAKPEFRTIRWIDPADFDLGWLPEMKKPVYRAVLQDFFNISLPETVKAD